MKQGISLIVFPVKDLAKAKETYGKLTGTEPYADAPYYLGYRVGGHEIGFDPNGHAQGMTGPVGFWEVADINATIKELVSAGATVQQDPKDVGGGKLTARLNDTDGNPIGLMQNP